MPGFGPWPEPPAPAPSPAPRGPRRRGGNGEGDGRVDRTRERLITGDGGEEIRGVGGRGRRAAGGSSPEKGNRGGWRWTERPKEVTPAASSRGLEYLPGYHREVGRPACVGLFVVRVGRTYGSFGPLEFMNLFFLALFFF